MGTTNSRVAQTVLRIAEGRNPLANQILNRNTPVNEALVMQTIRQTKFGWPGRRPRTSKTKTDMDLFSFLVPLLLSGKETVVELPDYKNRLPRRTFAEERHLGVSRFGQLVGLVSHRSLLSFSVQIRDQTIAVRDQTTERDRIGAKRTFMLVDYDGAWQPGFAGISWQPARAESEFRTRYRLSEPGHENGFAYYVHPNRRESIFGAPYLLLKILSMRIEDELDYYRSELRRLEKLGIYGSKNNRSSRTIVDVGPETGIMVPTFTATLRGVSFQGNYSPIEASVEGYDNARARIKYLANQVRPLVQFIVRADEVAFYHFGRANDYVAPWIKGVSFIHRQTSDPYRTSASFSFTNQFSLWLETDLVSQAVAA